MLREFKDFALRGSVVDMAAGFTAGVAFTALVKSGLPISSCPRSARFTE